MKFSTKSIHIGQKPDEATGAIIPPIYMTSTYIQDAPAQHKGYDYTRAGNPNFSNIEATLASLENGKFATVFSSGLGGLTGIISMLKAGDSVIGTADIYGGSYRLFKRIFSNYGISFKTINTQDLQEVNNALKLKPKMVFIESPTNPLLKITDIEKVTETARKYGVISVVDNTFATPYFQNPMDLGADIVLHSTTKYIGGHSDIVGGVVITNNPEFKEKIDFARMAIGLNPSPFDVWLGSRGIKTLGVRMEKHGQNAFALANFFKNHPKVKKVYYPGLESHPNYVIAKKQMSGFSGIVSVEFDMTLEETKKIMSSFKYFSLAESLGGIESLVDHPASMTHASIPAEERKKIGLSDGLVRFSVGIEDIEDLKADINNTLN
ncbi:MAG: PLP-dependent aspartate aminotransferase family protein [Bacteroidales bacterium]|nr:PLP-dependent aspartate aminotransferase family protein [Bacteroidales bacterium]